MVINDARTRKQWRGMDGDDERSKSTNKRLVLVVRSDGMKLPDRALVCLGFRINVDWTIWAGAERQNLVASVDFCVFGGF
jgi:hypothetical protein